MELIEILKVTTTLLCEAGKGVLDGWRNDANAFRQSKNAFA